MCRYFGRQSDVRQMDNPQPGRHESREYSAGGGRVSRKVTRNCADKGCRSCGVRSATDRGGLAFLNMQTVDESTSRTTGANDICLLVSNDSAMVRDITTVLATSAIDTRICTSG